MKVKSESEVAQSCLTLSNPMDCSPPGSTVHGIFQARVLEWGAIAFSGALAIGQHMGRWHLEAQTLAQTVKRLPAMRETQVQSLGQEDPLEKGMATHSSILAWKIPWTVEPGGL